MTGERIHPNTKSRWYPPRDCAAGHHATVYHPLSVKQTCPDVAELAVDTVRSVLAKNVLVKQLSADEVDRCTSQLGKEKGRVSYLSRRTVTTVIARPRRHQQLPLLPLPPPALLFLSVLTPPLPLCLQIRQIRVISRRSASGRGGCRALHTACRSTTATPHENVAIPEACSSDSHPGQQHGSQRRRSSSHPHLKGKSPHTRDMSVDLT